MRGEANQQATMLTAITPDAKVPQDHPVRAIKTTVDRALLDLWPVFNAMYANVGRPSMPPEHLLKAQLLMPLFSVPSARSFCEQLEHNLLFKWFLDRNVDDPHSTPRPSRRIRSGSCSTTSRASSSCSAYTPPDGPVDHRSV